MNTDQTSIRLAEQLCRDRGVRFTPQRRAVLSILTEAGQPIGAYDLLDRMRLAHPGAKPPTVYRALDFLLEHGLIHKLTSIQAFVSCTHPTDDHQCQFLICNTCNGIEELDSEPVRQSLEQASNTAGFKATRSVVELHGICRQCRKER